MILMKVAIIPARSGSKRIPNKNIKRFAGRPMISYSIEAAKKSKLFDWIIVSTDSDAIAEISRQWGAESPFRRPQELSDDYTATGPVVLHALHWMLDKRYDVRVICCIYATAPFLRAEDLVRGYQTMCENCAASAFSVTTFKYPIFRSLKIDSDGRLSMIWPEYLNSRSQDLPEAYHDAGQFYWADAKRFITNKRFLSKDAFPVILPRYLVQDIDTLEDWETAERMYLSLNSINASSSIKSVV